MHCDAHLWVPTRQDTSRRPISQTCTRARAAALSCIATCCTRSDSEIGGHCRTCMGTHSAQHAAHSTCSETRPSLQLGATGIGLQCAVDWRIEGLVNYGPGTATAILADASLGFGMSLSRDASLSGLATAGTLDQCTITAAPKLTFKGSFSSIVLNLLKPFITSTLSCSPRVYSSTTYYCKCTI